MANKQLLTNLINRIRSGDDTAMDELVTSYRGLVIRAIRRALEPGNSLRPLITTNDIMQSVNRRLARVLQKAQDGETTEPSEPIRNGFGYLVKIATRLVIDQARKHSSVKFVQFETLDDVRQNLDVVLADPTAADPSTAAEQHELMRWFLDQFTAADQELAKKWLEGRSSELSKTSQQRLRRQIVAIRKQADERMS